jgi:hypothetical protein
LTGRGITPAFAGGTEKPTKTSIRIAGMLEEIRTEELRNMSV